MPDSEHMPPDVRQRSLDRRVQHSQATIHEAFALLLAHRDYDGIRVADIIARAGVGRATFYAHFADKHALMVTQLRGVVNKLIVFDEQHPVCPDVRPLFEHLADFPQGFRSLTAGPTGPTVLAIAERLVAERLANVWSARPGKPAAMGGEMPPMLRARAGAALLFMLLHWWREQDPSASSQVLQDHYEHLLASTTGA